MSCEGSKRKTTTLGLAAAFARSGVEALAVDADRQLPDLHAELVPSSYLNLEANLQMVTTVYHSS